MPGFRMRFDGKNAGAKINKGTFARILRLLWKTRSLPLVVVTLCILVSSGVTFASAVFIKRLIDNVIVPGMSAGFEAVSGALMNLIVSMVLLYGLGVGASFVRGRLMADITQGTLMGLRNRMFGRMETLPLSFFDSTPHGEIMSSYTNDTDAVRELIGRCVPSLIESAFSFAAVFTVMLFYSVWLTLAVLLCCFFIARLSMGIWRRSAGFMAERQKALSAEEGYIEEMMEGQRVVKVFCRQEQVKKDFDALNDMLCENTAKANRLGNILGPLSNNLGNIMYVFVALLGTLLVYFRVFNLSLGGTGTITAGIIVSFLSMARTMSQTIGNLSQQVNMFTLGLAGASRIFVMLDRKAEYDEGYVTLVCVKEDADGRLEETPERTGKWAFRHPHKADGSVTYTPLRGDIVMDHVDFGYAEDKPVLHDITLYAKPGQKVAFVGATGAGKTTITNLLNRFYQIADGKIRYDGININKIRKPDLRRSLGIVLQDVNLFTGTVLENIRYGRLDATDEECIAAAKLANADVFISRLPDGYGTMLTGNGSQLSQGQRQLISIARAAVADPPVLIMDEATSSIDTRTEALVQQGMDNLMKGRTVFVIAHRLSTVRNSNVIMVLDHGRIIERGTHEELLNQNGVYRRLYTGAAELE